MKPIIPFIICLLLSFLCFCKPGDAQQVIRATGKTLLSVDFHKSGFNKTIISKSLEPDSTARHLLTRYINTFLDGTRGSLSKAEMDEITDRPSFQRCLLLMYAPKTSPVFVFQGEPENLDELRAGYLFELKKCCTSTLFSLADTLLARHIADGVMVLWDKTDVRRLPHFQQYLAAIPAGEFYRLAELAAVMHNAHAYKLRDSLMATCKSIKGFEKEYKTLATLVQTHPQFDEGTYNEAVYGSAY